MDLIFGILVILALFFLRFGLPLLIILFIKSRQPDLGGGEGTAVLQP